MVEVRKIGLYFNINSIIRHNSGIPYATYSFRVRIRIRVRITIRIRVRVRVRVRVRY